MHWSKGRIDHAVAAGILIADLGVLEAHWGRSTDQGRCDQRGGR
jgi:hypothetical protein